MHGKQLNKRAKCSKQKQHNERPQGSKRLKGAFRSSLAVLSHRVAVVQVASLSMEPSQGALSCLKSP